MSIAIDWDALTGGPDGAQLAEAIRTFINDRFQKLTLPRLIRSVEVQSFDFGTIAPDVELKDVCDPLADFYDDDASSATSNEEDGANEAHEMAQNSENKDSATDTLSGYGQSSDRLNRAENVMRVGLQTQVAPINAVSSFHDIGSTTSPRSATPAIPGGTSNMHLFHQPLSAGLTGPFSPFAAFAGGSSWPDSPVLSRSNTSTQPPSLAEAATNPPLSNIGNSDHHIQLQSIVNNQKEVNRDDFQVVMRLRYSGDVKLSITADILLDYPMPSFVGIPLTLNVTGMTFDGVTILAHIKKKAHFCFLSPEDADALIGREADLDSPVEPKESNQDAEPRKSVGSLFEEIKVESEIGQKTPGKQVLKNVGKVEKFVLEQVTKIFETEFVYPNFWTFLI